MKDVKELKIGVSLIIISIVFLIAELNLGLTDIMRRFWPLIMVLLGGVFLYRSFLFKNSKKSLFIGSLLIYWGILVLLLNSFFPVGFIYKIWPFFIGGVGFSLIPHIIKEKKEYRVNLYIAAITFILFSVILLPFTFGILKNFRDFLSIGWSILILIAGIVFIITYLIKKFFFKDQYDKVEYKKIDDTNKK